MPAKKGPGEQKHEYLALKEFGGVDTQPSRTALAQDKFHWLENLMPIGNAFAPAVYAPQTATATITQGISTMRQITIGSTDYMLCFTSAGGAVAVNLSGGALTTVAAGNTFTTPTADQWKSERAIIGDPTNGYFSWDGSLLYSPGSLATVSVTAAGSGYTAVPAIGFTGGGGTGATATASISGDGVSGITITAVGSGYTAAPTVTITGGGATVTATASAFFMPTSQNATNVAVYSGRAWLANGRVLTYTAPDTWYDFATADAAGSTTITEGFLRQAIQGLVALDNYLYVFGDSSIFIIGDLKVTGSITTFSFTNLSSTTGTTLKNTITSMERAILFTNKYGVYATFGASVQKISGALDGIFPDIDFTQNVSAGLATIYNILCYCVSFTYNDTTATRSIQAVYFGGKWFFTSQGDSLSYVAPVQISGVQYLYGTSSTDLRKLYTNTTATIGTKLTTALLPLESPILDKQFNRYGVEFTAPVLTTLSVALETEYGINSLNATGVNYITWFNSSNQIVSWTNTATQTVQWIATGFVLAQAYADLVGKYLGFTITSNAPQYVMNGILAEYEPRAPW